MSSIQAVAPAPGLGSQRLALAALGPVAIGAILATQSTTASPLALVPAVVFGVAAATSPALYIASAATGAAPSLARMVQAFGTALGAFGTALAGLLLPTAFLALSSSASGTTVIVTSAALGSAALLGLGRLRRELEAASPTRSTAAWLVFHGWALATLGIAGRFWWDLATEVVS